MMYTFENDTIELDLNKPEQPLDVPEIINTNCYEYSKLCIVKLKFYLETLHDYGTSLELMRTLECRNIWLFILRGTCHAGM